MASRDALRILLVDDDEAVARLIRTVLTHHGFGAPHHVTTGAGALEALEGVDVVLLDQNLPDVNGVDLLMRLRARPDPPAVVVVTAHGTDSLVATALRRGADDYVAKDATLRDQLPQVLERVRRLRALRQALSAAEHDLVRAERLAAIGEMTVTLHHQINNPLMAATAELDLLLHDGGLTPAQRGAVEGVRRSLDRVRDILRRSGELRDAKTVPYLDGIPMIDLEAGDAPVTDRGAAICYIADESLARVTGLLLRHTGFKVRRVRTIEDLVRWADAVGVTVVVVEGEAPASGGDPLAGFRPARDRGYTLVALVPGEGGAARAAGADHVVQVPFDPGTFGAELVAALRR